ncbi:MAG: aminoglycoside phosphotransferase family protein [Candidatus Aenigmarchaeota archaeon]|nr:aminoglycoside phosphotransferase family protein [Candidatus Aenigmarchaeota archaeon]
MMQMTENTPRGQMQERSEDHCRIVENLCDIFTKIISKSKIKANSYTVVEKGNMSVCLQVTDYSGQKYLIKICTNDRLFAETFWRKNLYENKLNVPKSIYIDCSKKDIGYMYEILEFIEGIHINTSISEELQYSGAYLIGQELRRHHNIAVSGFESVDCDGRWTKKTWIETLQDYLGIRQRHKCALELFTQKEIDRIYDYAIHDKMMDIQNPKLIHGDVGYNNLIYTPEKDKIYFLDPGRIIGGDPIFDLAYASMPWAKGLFFRGIMDGYEKEKPLTSEEAHRFRKLRLICLVSNALGLYLKKREYNPFIEPARVMLEGI